MKKNILVYPFDNEFNPILKHQNLLDEYQISNVVSLKGWGFCGKDAGESDNRSNLNYTVTNEFNDNLDQCDAVLFCETRTPVDFDKFIMPKVDTAVKKGKDIIFITELSESNLERVINTCNQYNVDFKYLYNNNTENFKKLEELTHFEQSILDINTPVIFIMGTSEKTNKFDIQLSLRENIMKKGYKISQVGSRRYCELLGFHSFPSFMYSVLDETSKIVMFNRYIKSIEINESPDIIIIGIPGGNMPFNDKFTNKFGIMSYEISQAVNPDICVFSSLYSEYNMDYFGKISNSTYYKLGYNIDCFNLSNNSFDWASSENNNKEVFLTINSNIVDEKIKDYSKLDTKVYNILNDDSANKMAEYLLDKLIKYAETEWM